MSFTSELDVCGQVVAQGIILRSEFLESEPKQCAALFPKQDNVGESQVINEEIVVSTNGHSPGEVDCQRTEATLDFEESLETCVDTAARFEESIVGIPLTEDSSITEKWDGENVEAPILKENELKEQEDDEETIATFVTAEGQHLALYAVEDSDEIFAVAVYNESDEPPNNFQFLMKADVERLIGQGAVRTVKKPSQMKRRVFTGPPPMFCRKEDGFLSQVNDKTSICDASFNSKQTVSQEENGRVEGNYEISQNYSDFITKVNSKSSDSVHTAVDEQSDITYLMMDDSFVNIAEQSHECQDDLEDELMEHSTVQYILLEADHQSDSELTFDEIQATLQNMKMPCKKSFETNDKKSGGKSPDNSLSILRETSMKVDSPLNEDAVESEPCSSPRSTIDRTCVTESDRQRLIDTLTGTSPPTVMATSQTSGKVKVKRSRKQQLISVDRDDGEIIIQPALMMNEELANKKRTRRRQTLSSQIRVAMAAGKRIKRTKRIKRRKVVEVIDLDVDEEDQQTTRNVVEITLDDNNKDKYSSDKENEIIMVRDSDSDRSDDDDDDDDESDWRPGGGHLTKLNGVIRCEHCSRNFRYRRTLKMHLLVCQKSPAKALNLDKAKSRGRAGGKAKKQYACKICQEKFDAAVALARHVRATHSQRKKKLRLSTEKSSSKSLRSVQEKEMSLSSSSEEEEESDEGKTTEKELSMLARVKRKRKRINYSLQTKKLNCVDCGRWFPSTALLDAHSLQHGIKKERKCHICKKFMKSRLLFLRHMRMHNDTQRGTGSSTRIMRRKLRARPSTRKIATPRKRGRPRKF
ncbi:PREDICTED: uncharacterized protein LOC105454433 isoform X2 [Wasmannia auropunctata]|uniref:uncharacterized protein LOC105454433 isoform X2 n=1 Tax=Wasmannia auropunctata TaxID=64793 RepID=UPI0005EDABA7|nr:PREDICTED: uncharacterized protein LOC105454433 isoform X2 [Wasmannia auropunctata]